MEKTCGNCGHAKVCAVFISSETGCCQWSPCVDTLKQRCQQLAEVARNLFKRTLVAYGGEDVSIVEIDDYRKQLEELGVEL
jgi:hypothetical protein